jgi:hypothetical protein
MRICRRKEMVACSDSATIVVVAARCYMPVPPLLPLASPLLPHTIGLSCLSKATVKIPPPYSQRRGPSVDLAEGRK